MLQGTPRHILPKYPKLPKRIWTKRTAICTEKLSVNARKGLGGRSLR